jgi:Secretion system C-terminal sorting domain
MLSLKRTFSQALLLVVTMAISSSSLFAAELFRKQTGTATIAAAATSITVTIPAVCLTQSFLVFSASTDTNNPGDFQVGGQMTNATTLTFTRFGNTLSTAATIKWQVFEFEGNVSVQRGITILNAPPVNIAITAVNLAKTFVIATMSNNGATAGDNDGFTADLTTTTNLQLSATAGNTPDFKVYWQVIEYQDALVKKFNTTLNAGAASTTTTISPAITTLPKAFVISNHTIGANVDADDLPRTELTNTTTVTYTRGVGTTAAMNFVTYVVEFTDLTTVARGTQAFGSGSVSQNVAVTAAASTGLFGPGNQGRQGSTSYATDDNLGHAWFNYELTSLTNLQITRAVGTGSTANAPYQLVTFEDQNTSPRTYYSFATGAWESNTSWSLSSDGSTGAVGVGVYPRRSDNVVIRTGHNITINSVTDNGLCGLSPDNLSRTNVGPFPKSSNIMFYQTGDILISGTLTVTGIEMMIEGYTKIVSGGTFTLASDLVNLGYLEADAGSTFSTLDDISLAGNSTTIINTNSISSDDLNISFTNATLCGTGTTTLTNGAGSVITYFNGATVAQICTTFTVACSGVGCSGFPVIGTGPSVLGITGPGGVAGTDGTTSLVLWLDANRVTGTNGATITTWNDLSGRGNNFTVGNGAIFNTNVVNSIYPAFNFNGTSHYFETSAFNASLTPANYTIFSTNRVTSSGAVKAVISNRDIVGGNTRGFILNAIATSNNWEFWTGNGTASFDITTNNTNTTAAWASQSMEYQVAANGKKLYINNSLASQNTHTMTANAARPVRVGAGQNETTPAFFFNGLIGEIIMFNSVLNTARQMIVSNYLSAKYNYTLAPANNIYTFDDAALTFDHEAAGIGQASDGSRHIDAKGTGIVRMWNPNGLANSEFLMWAHDNGALAGTTAGVDGAVIAERLVRIWRVGESADVGTVSISFDLSSLGSPLGSNLRLLIDRNANGFADNDVTPVVGSFISNTVVFSGIDFQTGDQFTLGNTNASIPLPIELVSFNAKIQNSSVLLSWSTASEHNNDFFTIERTQDAKEWTSIGTVKGMGNTNVKQNYSVVDEKPYQGVSYYRLKQTDFDKKFSYSKVVRVELEEANQILIYPNPSSRTFTLTSGKEIVQIKFLSTLGSILPISIEKQDTETVIDPGDISPGIYFIQVLTSEGIKSIRVIRK